MSVPLMGQGVESSGRMTAENLLMTDYMRRNKVPVDQLNLLKVFRSLAGTPANILQRIFATIVKG